MWLKKKSQVFFNCIFKNIPTCLEMGFVHDALFLINMFMIINDLCSFFILSNSASYLRGFKHLESVSHLETHLGWWVCVEMYWLVMILIVQVYRDCLFVSGVLCTLCCQANGLLWVQPYQSWETDTKLHLHLSQYRWSTKHRWWIQWKHSLVSIKS